MSRKDISGVNLLRKRVEPPLVGKPDLVLASIRRYSGYADMSIPEIPITTLDSKSLEKYLALSDEKSRLEKRKKEIDAEQRAISVPFVELMDRDARHFWKTEPTVTRLPLTRPAGR